MTDEIIKFDTAKLAKEKGFDLPSTGAYAQEPEEGAVDYETAFDAIGELVFTTEDMQSALEYEFKSYLAPTQSLLQRWLREKYQINVYPILSYTNNQKYTIELRFDFSRISTSQTGLTEKVYYDTYEEALEVGLVAALKLIKV